MDDPQIADDEPLTLAENPWIDGFLACLCLMTGRDALYEELLNEHLARRKLAEAGER